MATEEQTQQDSTLTIGGDSSPSITRGGQRLNISARSVETLSFWVAIASGSPVGDIKFSIYAVDDDELLLSKVLFDASSLTGSLVKYTVTFNNAVVINEEVRIAVVKDTDLSDGTLINIAFQNSDVKASEQRSHLSDGSWIDNASADLTYSYTFTQQDVGPNMTSLNITAISSTTATGHGLIVSQGLSTVTECGIVWKEVTVPATSPKTSDNKATSGTCTVGVPFTASITGLTPTKRYVAASYGINTEGTTYGDDMNFIADDPGSLLKKFDLSVVQERLHWVGASGTEYWVNGTPV